MCIRTIEELEQDTREKQVIDIRDKADFEKETYPDAINIYWEELEEHMNEIRKDCPVYLLCYTGQKSEEIAEELKEQGYELIGYNFRCRQGEIDIIARDGRYLVFVEVKYRRDGQTGDPLEAVDRAKQRRISRTAQYYCLTHGYGETTPCRFDVAAVLGTDGEVRLVKHAFEFQG